MLPKKREFLDEEKPLRGENGTSLKKILLGGEGDAPPRACA